MTGTGFVDAFGGKATAGLFSAEDARRLARRRLPLPIFDYIDGGTGREIAPAENRLAFDAVKLRPRVTPDTKKRNRNTVVFGEIHEAPFGIAPMGMSALVDPRADRAMAQASSRGRIPVCVAANGSASLEKMLEWSDGRAWFQLYPQPTEAATDALVVRAKEAGYRVLIVSMDMPIAGRRLRDLSNGLRPPYHLGPRDIPSLLRHPSWALRRLRAGAPRPANFSDTDRIAPASSISWEYLERPRDMWKGRLVIKGVTDPEDVLRLKSLQIDGLYVSNHGGTQLDGAAPAIESLWDIRGAAGTTMELLFDSGARSGEDIVKAIALGANMVMLGRPVLHAIGADGPRGLATYLDCVRDDLEIAMALVGVSSIAGIRPRCLAYPPPPHRGDGGIRLVDGGDAG